MPGTSMDKHQSTLLGLLARSADGRLKAGDLKKKLKGRSDEGPDAAEADRTIATLIDQGLIAVAGGSKEGHHPRPNATYRLTDQGKHHLKPTRPELSDEILRNQEAFILLQIFRANDQELTRSDLNTKLKTKAAVERLEFDVKATPAAVDYHLDMLVEKGCLDERRRGVSVRYSLRPERGLTTLASAKQHELVNFTMSGKTLNALLEAARGSASARIEDDQHAVDEPAPAAPTTRSPAIGADDIVRYIEHLQADKYAGKGLIPIHEVRRLVAERHGEESAGHTAFDPLLKRMRSEGQLELIAISDNRRATQEQLDASIPGINEIIFYIVVE